MARFYSYAEVLTEDHVAWHAHARGIGGCGNGPGVILREVLDHNGGRYENTLPFSPSFQEQLRLLGEVPANEELGRIAELTEVTISLEHLRGVDPGTRITCGYGLTDFTDDDQAILPPHKGPADPGKTLFGIEVDPASPHRILRQ